MVHIKSITTKLPTYLKSLLHDNCSVKLVFQEGEGHLDLASPKNEILEISDDISVLELTGTPLQTDLGNDDTVCAEVIQQRPQSWTLQEASQYPLTLKDARAVINDQLKSRKLNETVYSIYSICDGTDPQHTVGLGAMIKPNQLSRILVNILPCLCENDDTTTLDHMITEHMKSVRRKANVQTKVSTIKHYDLFGYDLQNCLALQASEHNGHIFVEISANDEANVLQRNTAAFQVVVGHQKSPLLPFWEDLCVIQSFVKLMENANVLNEASVIGSCDNLDCGEIMSLIGDIFLKDIAKKIAPQTVNLNNLRQLNILDSLWTILKQCNNVSDLRDSFHFFLEELAERQTRILITGENNSAIGKIVRGIVDGRIAVPALTISQSLELLVELGIEKLKKDYLAILKSFFGIGNEEYLKKWNELCSESRFLNSNQASQRQTRITINRKTNITDVTNTNAKLTFLDSMHTVAEFMFLCRENLPNMEQIFDSYAKCLCDRFIVRLPKVARRCDFKQASLHTFNVDVTTTDAEYLIKNKCPTAFTSILHSVVQRSEVWTVFHFSEHPIFPPSVFQDYEIPDSPNEVKILYVSKLVKYVENV